MLVLAGFMWALRLANREPLFLLTIPLQHQPLAWCEAKLTKSHRQRVLVSQLG